MNDGLLEQPSEELLTGIEKKIRGNRLLDAWADARKVSLPLKNWPHGKARKLASTLCDGLGNTRLGRALDWLNWRAERDNDEYYFLALFARLSFKSHYELIPEIEERLRLHQSRMAVKDQVNFLCFLAWAYALLRDFETAHRLLEQAAVLDPLYSWQSVQKSVVMEMEDRYQDSLDAAMRAVDLRPHYRPAVLQLSRVLIHLGRDDEAMDLLLRTHEATQNAAFIIQLMTHHSERDQHEDCLRCLDIAENLLPLMDETYTDWFAARRADFSYMQGDVERFKEYASQIKSGFQKKALENLLACTIPDPKRVKLDVPFIRQHNMTCAPATLASIAKFWGRDLDHLEIAAAICYDGTPWHKERNWAETNGFVVREFRVSREILFALIDRGIPFTLTTSSATSAHLQACIGYDQRLDAILLRDPTHRHYGEMLIKGLLEEHPLGPRGMVLVPKEKQNLLDHLHFPDAAAFDALHDLAIALDENDRVKAQAAMSLFRVIAMGSPLYWDAHYRYHQHHANLQEQWKALSQLLEAYPDHASFALRQMTVLHRMQRYHEQRALAEKMIAITPHDATFDSEYGEILLADARDLGKAELWLLRAMRRQSTQAHVYESLARCREKQRQFDEVVRLRKIASHLAPTSEYYAMAYYDSCRAVGLTEQGLTLLRGRVARFGNKDSGPWLTLANVYHNLNRTIEARDLLEEGRKQLPQDGYLLCRSGNLMMRWGEAQREEGMKLIRSARDQMPDFQWFMEMAYAHAFVGQRIKAIGYWKSYLALQPFSYKGYNSLAPLLADEYGIDHVLEYLQECCGKHPGAASLWALLAEWQAFTHAPQIKETLDRILDIDPDHTWALRERSEYHADHGDLHAALADAREACEKTPYLAESHGVLSSMLRKTGEEKQANEKLREAIILNIDYTWASESLLIHSEGADEQRAALEFIHGEMCRQVSYGDIVPTYQSLAYPILEPQVLLGQLRDFCQQRPDLWQTWFARKVQCQAMNLPEEAMECARIMTTSFPLLPRSWAELADAHHLEGNYEDECAALQKALDLSPSWEMVARRLAEVWELLRHYEKAEQLLRRMIDLEPLVAPNYVALASLLFKRQHGDEAVTTLRQCVSLIPLSRSAWDCYCEIARAGGLESAVMEDLQRISQKQSHRADWWLVAAETCSQLGKNDLVVGYCRRGLAIDAEKHDLRDLLAFTLTMMGQYPEAIAICQRDGKPMTREMQGRYCWILLQSGKPREAMEGMELLLKNEPDYLWNISMLASCRQARSQWRELRDLAKHWVRMDPRNAVAYGYLGKALLELNQTTEATKMFYQAVKIDPTYQYACRRLFELQLHDGKFADCEDTLVHLKHYAPGSATVCDEMDLRISQSRVDDAMRLIDPLLAQKDASPQQLRWLRDRLAHIGQEKLFSRWLSQYMAGDHILHEIPVILWIEAMQQKYDTTKCARQLQGLKLTDEGRVAAWTALIESTDQPVQLSRLDEMVKNNEPYFRSEPRLWNAVGYSYTNMAEFRKSADWLKDWDSREDATDVTYNNVAIALDDTKGMGEGNAARRKALNRFPGSSLMPGLIVFIAFEDILHDKAEEAESLLRNLEESRLNPHQLMILHFIRSMQKCLSAPAAAANHYRTGLSTIGGKISRIDTAMIHAVEQNLVRKVPDFRGKVARLHRTWGKGMDHPLRMQFIKYNRTFWIIIAIIFLLIIHWINSFSD